jgi:hypothetical protein
MKTKLSTLREFMAAGDWRAALKLADSFGDLGIHKQQIERGWAAYTRPDFYREIGKNPEDLIADARAALVERYGDPANNFAKSEM